jgi:hypothetical protein
VGGRAELPLEVDTWLMATQICLNRIQKEEAERTK